MVAVSGARHDREPVLTDSLNGETNPGASPGNGSVIFPPTWPGELPRRTTRPATLSRRRLAKATISHQTHGKDAPVCFGVRW